MCSKDNSTVNVLYPYDEWEKALSEYSMPYTEEAKSVMDLRSEKELSYETESWWTALSAEKRILPIALLLKNKKNFRACREEFQQTPKLYGENKLFEILSEDSQS